MIFDSSITYSVTTYMTVNQMKLLLLVDPWVDCGCANSNGEGRLDRHEEGGRGGTGQGGTCGTGRVGTHPQSKGQSEGQNQRLEVL